MTEAYAVVVLLQGQTEAGFISVADSSEEAIENVRRLPDVAGFESVNIIGTVPPDIAAEQHIDVTRKGLVKRLPVGALKSA